MEKSISKNEKIFGVYTHSAPEIGIFYVGKGDSKRATVLNRSGEHKKIVLYYGRENINVHFKPCSSEESSLKEEIKLISMYLELGFKLVNKTKGGQGTSGFKHTLEECERRRVFFKERNTGRKLSKEHKDAISKGGKGIKRSEETKRAISDGKKGAIFSKKHIENLRKNHIGTKGKTWSLETRQKISKAHKGKTTSQETKDKISRALKGRKRG